MDHTAALQESAGQAAVLTEDILDWSATPASFGYEPMRRFK